MNLIAPSMLACDFGNLESEISMINESKADWFHIDVMDGVFVPNISFGTPIMNVLKKYTKKPLDVHLMIINPDNYIEKFAELGSSVLTVHFEACTHLHRTIQRIKSLNMKAGVAINPHTPISSLESIIKEIDLVCIMSVNPGFGGQSFIETTYQKIKDLKSLINKCNSKTLIEIDGGVNSENAKKLIENGADVLVAGSFVFKSENPTNTISTLSSLIN
ncbi:MAG: ribulose-phosphate 3-epimerase [Flavobacteriaceae bacterium]|jgi:ribulose-phosphate 3-epimerase|nr:ribulose-phosphate 3-epimerase [Flavobacteriaceae bacterium]MBT3753802.1 ribulose-phosphate 3-epimerase [Flavobacteriaceae bacterium]MBT3794364.1 ribulose-phosphate 3-epimerase [Flavobacteriaceae bacterium]MBT4063168.1 ribulose-phosphate 3-epimerase [Flavobacteriaceae bacterium]MBT4415920.1 ribulose-phosphate 3-epimerase [Flavobacteriaceae bacterium]